MWHSLPCLFFFFFSSRRRHTRLTCDWSSDVCSSDLSLPRSRQHDRSDHEPGRRELGVIGRLDLLILERARLQHAVIREIGRASCRESVDLGGRRIITKKKVTNKYNKMASYANCNCLC